MLAPDHLLKIRIRKEWPYSILDRLWGYGMEYGGDDIMEYAYLERSTINVNNSLWGK